MTLGMRLELGVLALKGRVLLLLWLTIRSGLMKISQERQKMHIPIFDTLPPGHQPSGLSI